MTLNHQRRSGGGLLGNVTGVPGGRPSERFGGVTAIKIVAVVTVLWFMLMIAYAHTHTWTDGELDVGSSGSKGNSTDGAGARNNGPGGGKPHDPHNLNQEPGVHTQKPAPPYLGDTAAKLDFGDGHEDENGDKAGGDEEAANIAKLEAGMLKGKGVDHPAAKSSENVVEDEHAQARKKLEEKAGGLHPKHHHHHHKQQQGQSGAPQAKVPGHHHHHHQKGANGEAAPAHHHKKHEGAIAGGDAEKAPGQEHHHHTHHPHKKPDEAPGHDFKVQEGKEEGVPSHHGAAPGEGEGKHPHHHHKHHGHKKEGEGDATPAPPVVPAEEAGDGPDPEPQKEGGEHNLDDVPAQAADDKAGDTNAAVEEHNKKREQKHRHHKKHAHGHGHGAPAGNAAEDDGTSKKEKPKHHHDEHKHHRHRFHPLVALPSSAPGDDEGSDASTNSSRAPSLLPKELHGSKVAYAVVISNEDFIDGALAMGWSFLKQSPLVQSGQAGMVAIVPRGGIRDSSIQRLHVAGWDHVVQVHDLTKEAPRAKWAPTFNKLYLFNLTEYSRVATFDVDMLMLRNPDNVFASVKLADENHIGALGNTKSSSRYPYFQTGMMLIVPHTTIFDKMMKDFHTNPECKSINGRDGSLIRRIFKDRYSNLNGALSSHLAPGDHLGSVIGFHFRGDWKPWLNIEVPPDPFDRGMHGIEIVQEMGEAYHKWWQHYEELHVLHLAKLDEDTRNMEEHDDGYPKPWPAEADDNEDGSSDAAAKKLKKESRVSREETKSGGSAYSEIGKYNPRESVWLNRWVKKKSYTQLLSNVSARLLNRTHPGLVLHKGAPGESCHLTCGKRQMVCLQDALSFSEVNNCDTLKEVFGCSVCYHEGSTAEFPAFDKRGGYCKLNTLFRQSGRPSCAMPGPSGTQRLCACATLETAYEPSIPIEGSGLKPKETIMTKKRWTDYKDGEHAEGGATSTKDAVCDPTQIDWIASPAKDAACIDYLTDPSNIVSLKPMGSNSFVGRTVKFVATYKLHPKAEQDEGHFKAMVKVPQANFPLEPYSEVAAHAVDRALGLHRVPPTGLLKLPVTLIKKSIAHVTENSTLANRSTAFLDAENNAATPAPHHPIQKPVLRENATIGGLVQEQVWSFLDAAGLHSKFYYDDKGSEGDRLAVSVQLLFLKVHVLNDSPLKVPSDKYKSWFGTQDGKAPSKQDYPEHAQSMDQLSAMSLLDFVIGNADRSIGKNCFVHTNRCQQHCTRPLDEIQQFGTHLPGNAATSQLLFLDQGKSFYLSYSTKEGDAKEEDEKAGGGIHITPQLPSGNLIASFLEPSETTLLLPDGASDEKKGAPSPFTTGKVDQGDLQMCRGVQHAVLDKLAALARPSATNPGGRDSLIDTKGTSALQHLGFHFKQKLLHSLRGDEVAKEDEAPELGSKPDSNSRVVGASKALAVLGAKSMEAAALRAEVLLQHWDKCRKDHSGAELWSGHEEGGDEKEEEGAPEKKPKHEE